jgi:hypothetical protein
MDFYKTEGTGRKVPKSFEEMSFVEQQFGRNHDRKSPISIKRKQQRRWKRQARRDARK